MHHISIADDPANRNTVTGFQADCTYPSRAGLDPIYRTVDAQVTAQVTIEARERLHQCTGPAAGKEHTPTTFQCVYERIDGR